MFQKGDQVVFRSSKTEHGRKSIGIFTVWSNAIQDTPDAILIVQPADHSKPMLITEQKDIRHATPKDIAAGHNYRHKDLNLSDVRE